MKILDSSNLQDSMEARAKHYKNLREQFIQLKRTFSEIVGLDDFEGKGAEAIKGFYQGQIDVVEAWQRLIDRQIAFFEGVAGKLQDKNLGGNTRVETDFLETDLSQKERIADEMITEQKRALDNIFREIDDLVSLDSFSRSEFDDKMADIHKKRTKTLDVVDELDQELKEEYNSSEGEEGYVIQLFGALLEATKQGSTITPINFNSEAFHASEAYQVKSEAEEVTDSYLTFKKDEKEAREIENRPWYEDFWEGTKTFAGEFSGYYDYKRATEGVDPVTGEKLSTTQRVTAGAMALAGFIPVVGWAGRAVKGGKGIYSATKGVSAAEHAMSAYKNVRSFSTLEKTEMGIYGLISTNGLSEYLTGKDMLGNELTDEQRKASLAQGIFAGLPFVPSMAKEANRLGQQAVKSSVQLGKQGRDVTQAWLDDLGNQLNNFGPQLRVADGVGNVNKYRESRSLNLGSMNSEKEELLSMLSGRSNQVSKAKVETVLKDSDLDDIRAEWKVPETHTIAVGKAADIPGLEDKVFKGGSIKVRREAGLKDLDDIFPDRDIQAPYSQTNPRHIQFLKHAEEGVIAEFDAAIKELGIDPNDVKGTIYMHQSNPTGVCSICTQGISNPKKAAGIFKQFTDKYPNLSIVVTTQVKDGVRVSGKQEFVLQNGQFVE
ncbi:ribonuclease YeeF family protein [Niallia taxi]|uniref:ribonuclease YeeF family protein n=1 Tax=Niallia taxi TaxID=2499688 RepID=UPI002E246D4C|nr:T7SS effector LXG polymorphic toxin [Niallia taxi]